MVGPTALYTLLVRQEDYPIFHPASRAGSLTLSQGPPQIYRSPHY